MSISFTSWRYCAPTTLLFFEISDFCSAVLFAASIRLLIREIELGMRNPTVETLSYFCDALGVTLEEFFREEDSGINPCLMSAVSKLSDKEQMALAGFLNAMNVKKRDG